MVESTQSGSHPWDQTVQEALEIRLEGIESGRYCEENERVLTTFVHWLARERGVTGLEEISTTDCRRYAQALRSCVKDESTSLPDHSQLDTGQSAQRYYTYVRAWLGWCVRDERLDRNPAVPDRATEPLPEAEETTDRQFWSERERKAICATADQLVDESFEDENLDTAKAYRDRALVYTLAYSGCRGAELLRVPSDDRRDGVEWADVNLERGLIEVLGKSRDPDEPPAPLLSPAHDPLRRWQEYSDAEPDDPVFPRLDPAAGDDPDAISTESARRTLRDLCEWSDYEFESPLLPHGARRGLGSELYEENAELAQEMLRHQSIETTHDAYREEQQVTVREAAEDALLDE